MDCIAAKSWTGLSDFHFHVLGFPGSSDGKESTCNVGDHGMIPGSGRFPWRRERLPMPVFWPGELHGLYSSWGHKELDMTEQLFTFGYLF